MKRIILTVATMAALSAGAGCPRRHQPRSSNSRTTGQRSHRASTTSSGLRRSGARCRRSTCSRTSHDHSCSCAGHDLPGSGTSCSDRSRRDRCSNTRPCFGTSDDRTTATASAGRADRGAGLLCHLDRPAD